MKILFMRHAESVDDIENRYGGWSDYPLTENGRQTIKKRVAAIQELRGKFEAIFTSPLQRAVESGEILSKELHLPLIVSEFLKERNTYGVLTGMKKEDAQNKYPELVEKANNGDYIFGSERYEDLIMRVKEAMKIIQSSPYESIIVVTHGNFMKCIYKECLNTKVDSIEDGGFLFVNLEGEYIKKID